MYIRKFTYKKEDLDCKLCTEYRGKKHSCPHDVCPFIAERIEAGAVTYAHCKIWRFRYAAEKGG